MKLSRPTKWVKINKFCEWTGYTRQSIADKRYKGQWLDGIITKEAPDGNILVNLEEFEKWVESTKRYQ